MCKLDVIEMQLIKLQRDLVRALDANKHRLADELEEKIETLQVQYDNELHSK